MDYFSLTKADKLIETDKASIALYLDKGYLGMFSCEDIESGTAILFKGISALKEHGHKKIIAPIDGNTWFTYRLISSDYGEPPFPLETQNPIWYNDCFINAGFKVVGKYYSDIFDLPSNIAAPVNTSEVTLRKINTDNVWEEMRIVYDLSMDGFDNNFLFSDISFEQFMALYSKVIPMLNKDLICIAQMGDMPVGFLFCIDGGGGRLVMKSMAVKNEYRNMGIGTMLADYVLYNAAQIGFNRVIGAYIKQNNFSGNIVSKHHSKIIREYSLYGLEV